MKKAVIFGNCQTIALSELLTHSKKFCEQYHFIPKPVEYAIHLISKERADEIYAEVREADVLLVQPISESYRSEIGINTEKLKNMLPDHAQCITFPACYWDGYTVDEFIFRDESSNILDPVQSSILLKSFYEGKNQEEAYENYLKVGPLDNYVGHTMAGIAELKRREQELDIVISNCIEQHYKQTRLFHSTMHPSNKILFHIIKQFFEQIGLEDDITPQLDSLTIANPLIHERLMNPSLPVLARIHANLECEFVNHLHCFLDGDYFSLVDKISKSYDFYQQHKSLINLNMQSIESKLLLLGE